jgi:hypothetical protein
MNSMIGRKIVRNVQSVIKPDPINMTGQKIVRIVQSAIKPDPISMSGLIIVTRAQFVRFQNQLSNGLKFLLVLF